MCGLPRGPLLSLALLACLPLLAGPSAARPQLDRAPLVEVVVGLAQPPLARAAVSGRVLAARTARGRLNLRAPATVFYLQRLATAQRALAARIRSAIPQSRVRWRYQVVANGIAVVVPADRVAQLDRIAGVARVYPTVRYHALLDRSPGEIGAPTLWGPNLGTAGQGVKIGIIDDGVDQSHQFFNPSGFSMPAGFPKGQTAFTTAKVIAARAFAPPTPSWKYASRPFDPENSEHATHVAGIAAGDADTPAAGTRVSGIAPKAYLGNYKVLTIPTPRVGLDGNSPEIAAGIEAAVRDGMDVINLSLGEPEMEPSRDLVVEAIDAAADAGVVPAIAAGNDFQDVGRGSIGSPGSAAKAITAAAVTTTRGSVADLIADFSSSGPTPVSLQLKPDVAAPGQNILSSVPAHAGSWAVFSGTSMASPHVAGAAALLRERHPAWTVAQIKSALVLTGDPVFADSAKTVEVPTTREGGGLIDLPRADNPKVFTDPATVSFGFVKPGESAEGDILLNDAGGGSGSWSVSVAPQIRDPGVEIAVPALVSVPGALHLAVRVAANVNEQELTGFLVLSRGADRRRIPYWLRITAPKLAGHPRGTLARTGTYASTTSGQASLVSSYRYPDDPSGLDLRTSLAGPERVYRVTLRNSVANFGVAVLSQGAGVQVEPRVLVAGDENRLTGYPALPVNLNPYVDRFLQPQKVVGAILPAPGAYDVVFDTPSSAQAGRFTFRFWIDDHTPPAVKLASRTLRRGAQLVLRITDAGSGVDPATLSVTVDGTKRRARFNRAAGRALLSTAGLGRGRHSITAVVSDFQEAKNMEDVARILPNTRRFSATFQLR
jgi:subtilisin family serine protease